MSIGYACLTVGVLDTDMKSITQKNVTEESLTTLISHNLQSLERMIDFNEANNIKLFRISSGLIPFGSSPVNELDWSTLFKTEFQRIGEKIKQNGMRVSFHPGQYTVLNSPDEGVVARAIDDLDYHVKVLEALGTDASHKVVLHVGGIYGEKETAMARFASTYQTLEQRIKDRLVIENDDRLYNIEDVLALSRECEIPVVYDNLHNAVNPSDPEKSDAYWIEAANATWQEKDGKQKIHYSQQDAEKRLGAHTPTIYLELFLDFYRKLPDPNVDIMLEVKDKNLSAVKCIVATEEPYQVRHLEEEWARYKYAVLEKSPAFYEEIRELLKNKEQNQTVAFYRIIEQIYALGQNAGYAVNAAQHVWGYFKNVATEKEESAFFQRLGKYQQGTLSLEALKRYLWKLTVKYEVEYLLQSLYFAF